MLNPPAKKRLRKGKKSHKKENNPLGARGYVQDSGVDEFTLQDAESNFEPTILYPDETPKDGSS